MYSLRKLQLMEGELAEIANEKEQLERRKGDNEQRLQDLCDQIEEMRRQVEDKKSSSEDAPELEERLRLLERTYDKRLCPIGNDILHAQDEIKKLDRRTEELKTLRSGEVKEVLRDSFADVCDKEHARRRLEDSLLPEILELIDRFVDARRDESEARQLYGTIVDRFNSSGDVSDKEIKAMEAEIRDKCGCSLWEEHSYDRSTSDSIRKIERVLTELFFRRKDCRPLPLSISQTVEKTLNGQLGEGGGDAKKGTREVPDRRGTGS